MDFPDVIMLKKKLYVNRVDPHHFVDKKNGNHPIFANNNFKSISLSSFGMIYCNLA